MIERSRVRVPAGAAGEFSSPGSTFCAYSYFGIRSTPVLPQYKRSRSFCQKRRWQVTAKHTYTLPVWLWMKWHCKLVNGWMVYTELAPRCSTSLATTKERYQYTTSVDTKNARYKRMQSLIQNHIVQELCESRGGRPGLSVLTSLLVSVDVKNYWTVLRHSSQLVPNMSNDIWGH